MKMSNTQKLKQIIAKVPDTSGVYLMKDASGRVIYVGKAKSLRKRLNTYMGRDLDTKTVMMMGNVADIEYRLTPTESLALLLEANLIHKYHPRYNISMRDDKSFPLVKITREDFPAICITREKEEDGARYLGPYTSAGLLREALKVIRRHFPFRSCREMPSQACIYYRIGLSTGPCIGEISKRRYAKTVKSIIMILEGRAESLMKKLTLQMKRYSKQQKYEAAAEVRDQIAALGALGESHAGSGNQEELEDLRRLLHLSKLPQRIEAFDISNIRGEAATGSMVSFYRGNPDKNNYRKFRIKTVTRIDDYGMIAEVVRRRYSRLKEERLPMPDLVLIDGGKGHLLTASRELGSLGLSLPLVSIAKEEENIYVKGKDKPIKLTVDTPGLNLIRRLRDEAHRFAVAYHHVLRRKRIIGK
jgi:excinuclease ABC subunit C